MKLCEIILDGEYESASLPREIEIKRISRKAEEAEKDSLLFLFESIKDDKKNIINHIIEKPPKVLVCTPEEELPSLNCHVIRVKNLRRAYALAYSRFYSIDYTKAKFVAVTGTNGKTSTATLIYKILISEGKKSGFIGTGKIEIDGNVISGKFYSMTTPDPELLYPAIKRMQEAECEFIIMEVSSHALFFDKLAPIEFEIGIFTNLGKEHLDFHKSLDSYYEAKLKLFSQSKLGIFNTDDKYSRRALCSVKCKAESVGILWPADAMAREIVQKGIFGTEYIYKEKALIFKAKIALVGAYNIYNSLFAIKACIALGIKPCRIKNALESIKSIEGRFEITTADITVINDFAHTPEAFDNLLKTAKSLKKQEQNITIVFGCGGERDKAKRPLIAQIAEKYCNLSIITNDNARGEAEEEIIADILCGFSETDKRIVITDRKKAIEYAIISASVGDIVIVAGKGAEGYIIDKNGYRPFSDRNIIRDALQRRKELMN